ncbi:hypothetical protein QNO07_07070 [Streptomyces sp. 549]|uniref:hypothetical protein n=1 Tax=Streptomyces sp. 549 TaxID=3049076 RepID=UPI0024C30D53|nr:hypothetical protein [Streptomyces sp. 549]MDK1473184.1 hypothetical protein [Streptomyces sp. 549]
MGETAGGGATHPAVVICREAAAAHGVKLVESPHECVLHTAGEGATLVVVYAEDTAVLWVDHHKWSEYDWTPEDRSALDDLAEAIGAVRRGDAELYFRRNGHLLSHVGGRIGNQRIRDGSCPRDPLVLPLPAWESLG